MARRAKFLYLNDEGDYEQGMSAGVFITDVQPQNPSDVINITWIADAIHTVVGSIETDTEQITVSVEWDGTAYHFNGEVHVNGHLVTNVSQIANTRRFEGTVSFDLLGATEIIAEHSDGAYSKADVTLLGGGPEILDVKFVNGYPNTQTEVKENDTFEIEVHFDPAGSEPSHLEVNDFGACVYGLIDLSGTELDWGTVHKSTITGTIKSTSTTAQALPAQVRARNAFGTFGDTLNTNHTGGTVDEYDLVFCNDRTPAISFGNALYASGLDALKDAEIANVEFTWAYLDSIIFTSPNNELLITNTTVAESLKTVQRISGGYNVTQTNLRAVATRNANATQTTANKVVYIAHAYPSISISEPTTRLISGGNDGTSMQNHTITLASNQRLRSIPTLNAPEGNLSSFGGTVPGTTFFATLGVHDNDDRGVFPWQSLSAENLAGQIQTVINGDDTYEIGGFVSRDIYFSPQANEAVLGTNVSDPIKTVCLDKDLQLMEYRASDLSDYRRGYSFTDPSNVFNAQGNILFWCDVQDVENNTTGLSSIRIREDA